MVCVALRASSCPSLCAVLRSQNSHRPHHCDCSLVWNDAALNIATLAQPRPPHPPRQVNSKDVLVYNTQYDNVGHHGPGPSGLQASSAGVHTIPHCERGSKGGIWSGRLVLRTKISEGAAARRYKRASDASALTLQLTVHFCPHCHMEHNCWHVSRHKSVARDKGNIVNAFGSAV